MKGAASGLTRKLRLNGMNTTFEVNGAVFKVLRRQTENARKKVDTMQKNSMFASLVIKFGV